MKVRWLDCDRPVKYVGRANASLRGRVGRVVVVGKPRRRAPLNVMVEFTDGERVVCPVGVLRNVER